ncbi:MAG: hypothetical protein ACYTCU_08930 [Planctomycetota bacterium]|jgi:hypothetical protein
MLARVEKNVRRATSMVAELSGLPPCTRSVRPQPPVGSVVL